MMTELGLLEEEDESIGDQLTKGTFALKTYYGIVR